jgi:hypothetical protein
MVVVMQDKKETIEKTTELVEVGQEVELVD